jgi:hypothetical protein
VRSYWQILSARQHNRQLWQTLVQRNCVARTGSPDELDKRGSVGLAIDAQRQSHLEGKCRLRVPMFAAYRTDPRSISRGLMGSLNSDVTAIGQWVR